ncbi:MAG: HlyD family efflux transporter periplasmic adaptor subunit [Candidatus Latescibacterota bacterium]
MDRPIRRKRWTLRRLAALAAATGFVALSAYGFLKDRGLSKLNVEADKLTVSVVERAPFVEFIPVRGTVLPGLTVYVEALEGGRVEAILVEEGTMVEQGHPLLRLANEELLRQVMDEEAPLEDEIGRLQEKQLQMARDALTARQGLLENEYQLQQAQRDLERHAALREALPRAELERLQDDYQHRLELREIRLQTHRQDSVLAQLQLQQLEADIERKRGRVELVRRRLDDLTVRAPIAGQLSELDAEIGESKGRGERIGKVDVLDRYKVRTQIEEFYIARVERGQQGTFELAGREYGVVTDKVYPEVQDGRFEVDLQFTGQTPSGIRKGQTLQIRLELGNLEEALLLAQGGFYQKTGGNWVYVLTPQADRATKREIRIGRKNPQFFEVLEGLEPGERVITSSYDNFGDMDVLVLR